MTPSTRFTKLKRGRRGRRGLKGTMPRHEWSTDGTQIRFESAPGVFGDWSSPAPIIANSEQ